MIPNVVSKPYKSSISSSISSISPIIVSSVVMSLNGVHHHQQQQHSSHDDGIDDGIDDDIDYKENQNIHHVEWVPCNIELENVSLSYPVSLWRKLTSSVPRREYAIKDITLTVKSGELTFLVGSSSCGKSTLLKLIQGTEKPTTSNNNNNNNNNVDEDVVGLIKITSILKNNNNNNPVLQEQQEQQQQQPSTPPPLVVGVPILLEERPTYYYTNNSDTIGTIWQNKIKSIITHIQQKQQQQQQQKDGSWSSSNSSSLLLLLLKETKETTATTITDIILRELSNILDLSLQQKAGTNLSSSQCYRCCLGEACLESILLSMIKNHHQQQQEQEQQEQEQIVTIVVPAPIILLDEWMDTETSTVIQRVQSSILNLVDRTGGIVINVTHKQDLYYYYDSHDNNKKNNNKNNKNNKMRCITLSRGSILSDTN